MQNVFQQGVFSLGRHDTMNDMQLEPSTLQALGALSVVVGACGYAFYIRGIIAGEVKPHAFSWTIWGILTAVAFFAQVSAGAGPGAWVTGFTALMSFGFVAVGLGVSSRRLITPTDGVFFAAALAAIPLWYFSGNALWSVVLITVVDAVAFVPTFRKAYADPRTESSMTYALSGLKFVFGIVALSEITLTTALYPASLVLMNGAFVVMVLLRRAKV